MWPRTVAEKLHGGTRLYQGRFYAATPDQEMKSPDLEVNVLVSMENVTERVRSAVKNAKTDQDQFAARKAILADIERESRRRPACARHRDALSRREYWLCGYKKYTDVRVVFAPEEQIAFSGRSGQLYLPALRFGLCAVSDLRKWETARKQELSEMEFQGRSENELVFVTGHPGSTQRLDTVAQLEFERTISRPM